MKSNDNSPKTPGGISKTLLTPCRRLGLSRKFNRKGPSPFISPLRVSHNSIEVATASEVKKRKICTTSIEPAYSPQTPETVLDVTKTIACISSPTRISVTPVRNVPLSKKNSKSFLLQDEDPKEKEDITNNRENDDNSPQNIDKKPLQLAEGTSKKNVKNVQQLEERLTLSEVPNEDTTKFNLKESNLINMPNNLNKECIVLIQKKMLKHLKSNIDADTKLQKNKVRMKTPSVSQTIFDSDSDDLPLSILNNKLDKKSEKKLVNIFVEKKNNYSISNASSSLSIRTNIKQITEKKTVQNEFDNDDDDFEVVKKKTRIDRKTCEKVVKLSKAKSTGSITQKDIDEIKSRIEMKKKLLAAKAMTEDTEELRNLIKKWQKGCQEALFELFDLMKKKIPENHNMDYLEILQNLKIPPELVGYDIENDCFITPDDSSIILSSLNN